MTSPLPYSKRLYFPERKASWFWSFPDPKKNLKKRFNTWIHEQILHPLLKQWIPCQARNDPGMTLNAVYLTWRITGMPPRPRFGLSRSQRNNCAWWQWGLRWHSDCWATENRNAAWIVLPQDHRQTTGWPLPSSRRPVKIQQQNVYCDRRRMGWRCLSWVGCIC